MRVAAATRRGPHIGNSRDPGGLQKSRETFGRQRAVADGKCECYLTANGSYSATILRHSSGMTIDFFCV